MLDGFNSGHNIIMELEISVFSSYSEPEEQQKKPRIVGSPLLNES